MDWLNWLNNHVWLTIDHISHLTRILLTPFTSTHILLTFNKYKNISSLISSCLSFFTYDSHLTHPIVLISCLTHNWHNVTFNWPYWINLTFYYIWLISSNTTRPLNSSHIWLTFFHIYLIIDHISQVYILLTPFDLISYLTNILLFNPSFLLPHLRFHSDFSIFYV